MIVSGEKRNQPTQHLSGCFVFKGSVVCFFNVFFNHVYNSMNTHGLGLSDKFVQNRYVHFKAVTC